MSVNTMSAAEGSLAPEQRGVRYITPDLLHGQMAGDSKPVVLDVRRDDVYLMQPFKIPGARPPIIPALPPSTPIVIYCT